MFNFMLYLAALISVCYCQPNFGYKAVSISTDGKAKTIDVGRDEFNRAFAECPVVQYTRNGRVHSIYKRLSPIPYGFDAYDLFTYKWSNVDNVLHTDFEIYSDYQDLWKNQNEWDFCNYNDADVGYPRDCGRSGRVIYTWFSFPGGRFSVTNGAGFAIHQPDSCPSQVPMQKNLLKSLIAEGNLSRDNKISNIDVQANYELSFTIVPRQVFMGWTNIIHLTTNQNGNCCNMGYRIPGVWFHSMSTKLHICTGCNGVGNKCLNPDKILPIGTKTKVTVLVSNGVFRVLYDNQQVESTKCTLPFNPNGKRAIVYLSDKWYENAKALVENVVYSKPRNGRLVFTYAPPDGIQLRKDHKASNIEVSTNYEVTFTLKPLKVSDGWSNIIHITTDEVNGNCCKMGYRIPGVWFHSKTTKLHICTGCGGSGNFCLNPIETLSVGKTTDVAVRVNEGFFTVHYDGREVGRAKCTSPFTPKKGQRATVFLSDRWYGSGNAMIENVVYSRPTNKRMIFSYPPSDGTVKLSKGYRVSDIVISEDYQLSFGLIPRGVSTGWTNIIHLTTNVNGNCCNMGYRIPGVWFHSETTKLHICTGCNGNGNTCLNPSQSLPVGKETKVTVRVYNGFFTAHYGNVEVGRGTCTSPFKPRKGQLATVYVSDKWYPSGNADINSVVYILPSNRLLTLSKPQASVSLRKGNKVADIQVTTNYEVSFSLTPRGVLSGWTNIIHVTTDGNCCGMGDRIPGVWFHSMTTKLHVCTGCNGRGNTCLNPSVSLPIGRETKVTVLVNDGIFAVWYGNHEVGRATCTSPFKPRNGQIGNVYLSDNWYGSAKAVVKNVVYSLPTTGVFTLSELSSTLLKKNNKVADIPVSRNFEVTFTLIPKKAQNGWTNIIHITTGANGGMGGRIPGVWFHSGTTKLHICTGCYANANTCLNPTESLPIGRRTLITVRVSGGVFAAKYGNREVASVMCLPFEPSKGQLASAYLSDMWYPSAYALVENVVYSTLPVFTYPPKGGMRLRKDNRVSEFKVSDNYEVSFGLIPRGVSNGWTNIIHITTGANGGMGGRIPGVWFHSKTTKLHICTGCDGNDNTCLNPAESLPIDKKTIVSISVNGGFFTVQYNSREVGSAKCTSPYNPPYGQLAMVYLGDPWYPSANAMIENIVYSLPSEGLHVSTIASPTSKVLPRRGKKLADIEVRSNYEVSFTLIPQKVSSGWTNVIHITTSGNCCNMGSRIPGVWFHNLQTKLHVCTGCSGVGNTCLNPTEALPIGKETRITVRVNGGVFTTQYNSREVGRAICTSPFKPIADQLATVYLSDEYYPSANTVIRDFSYSLPREGLLVSSLVQPYNGRILMANVDVLQNYEFSFTINPKKVKVGWTELLHMSIDGGNCCGLGQRIPGVFFISQTTKMHICTGCGKQGNSCINTANSLPVDKDTRVLVRVHSGMFTAYFNGQKIVSKTCVNPYNPNGKKAVLYLSDKTYNVPNAIIKDVTYTAPRICTDCTCQMIGREECYLSPVTGCCKEDCQVGERKPVSGSYTW